MPGRPRHLREEDSIRAGIGRGVRLLREQGIWHKKQIYKVMHIIL